MNSPLFKTILVDSDLLQQSDISSLLGLVQNKILYAHASVLNGFPRLAANLNDRLASS